MADKHKRKSFGKLPASLRDQILRGELLKKSDHCFALMGSFGPESRVGVDTIAECMAVNPATVRKLQKGLVATGWIVLLREGRGGGKKGEGNPREWWLNDYPFQHQLDADTKLEVAKLKLDGDAPILQDTPLKTGRVSTEGASGNIPETTNINTEKESIAPLAFKEMENLYREGWKEFYAGEDYGITGLDRKRLKELRDANPPIKKEVWVGKMVGYFRDGDKWVKDHRHPMSTFCGQFNSWTVSAMKPGDVRESVEGMA